MGLGGLSCEISREGLNKNDCIMPHFPRDDFASAKGESQYENCG